MALEAGVRSSALLDGILARERGYTNPSQSASQTTSEVEHSLSTLVLEPAGFRKLFSISRETLHLSPAEGDINEAMLRVRNAGDLICLR